jgi:hypothetical protein
MNAYRLKGASGAVTNQTFAGRHAEIVAREGSLELRSLDPSAELLLNGRAVTRADLASGDEIRIANCRFVLQAPGLRPDKVLTAEAISRRRGYLPWLIVVGLLAAAAAAWYLGLLSFR